MNPTKYMAQLMVRGFSTLEILLAGAVFSVFSWGVVEVVLTSLGTTRLEQETVMATNYATEGLEAMRALKESQFDALTITEATGLGSEDGFFVLEGTSDTQDDKYVRTIAIEAVERDDASTIASSGTVDPDTVHVIVTVTWAVTPSRENTVVLETYFTRWQS